MTAGGGVLVLGATSLIGRFALPRLIAAGREVWAVSRRPGVDPGVTWVRTDLTAPGFSPPSAGAALSLSPLWLLPPALPALQAAGVKRLVAFSSTSRFSKAASPEPGERAVAERLAAAEAQVAAFCDAAGIGWTVLRPTLIYAEGRDGNVSRIAGLIRRFGVFPLAGAGAGLRQPVHADDLAAAAIVALDRPAVSGRSYDLSGGETLTYRAMVARIFEGLERSPRIVQVPPAVWRLALRLGGGLLPGVNAAMGARMDADLTFDAAPAVRDLDWAPRAFHPRFR